MSVHVAARAVHLFLQSPDEDDNAKRILLRLRQFEHVFALDWKVLTREREDAVLISWSGYAFCSPRFGCRHRALRVHTRHPIQLARFCDQARF